MQQSGGARTLRAGLWSIAGRLASKVLDFLSLLVLARLLTPADFGLIAMGMTVVLVVEAILELPLSHALLRLQDPPESAFDTAFTLSVLRGLTIAVILGCISIPLAHFYAEPRLTPLVCAQALAPILRGLVSPRMTTLQRQLDFRWNVAIEVAGKVAALTAACIVAVQTRSYWALVAATVVGPGVMTLLSYAVAPHRPRLRLTDWSHFASMTGWFSLSQLLLSINWQLDKFVLGRFVNPAALGRFFMAENIASIPGNAITGPLSGPVMASLASLRTPEALRDAYRKASNAYVMLGLPFNLGLALLAEPLALVVLGREWVASATLLRWIAFSNLLILPVLPVSLLAMVTNRTRSVAWQSAIGLAVRLPATIVGVAYFGIPGALCARFLANACILVTGTSIVSDTIDVGRVHQLKALGRPALIALLFSVFLTIENRVLALVAPGSALVGATALAIAAAGVCYAALCFGTWTLAGRPPGIETLALKRLGRMLPQRWAIAVGAR